MNRAQRRRLKQADGGCTATSADTASLLQEAVAHHQAGQLQQAEEGYRALLEHNPSHAAVLHLLGVKNHQTGENETASGLIARAIEIESKQPVYYNNLALVLQALGRPDEAVDRLRKAVELDSSYVDARYNLGKCFQDLGDANEAARHYQDAIAINPNHAEALSNLGTIYQSQGRHREAVAAQRRAVAANPNLSRVHYNLGNALRELQQRAEAIEAYQCALSLEPGHQDAWCNLGMTQKELGRRREAIASLRQACQIDPSNAGVLRVLGLAYFENGEPEQAIRIMREAITVEPDNGSGHHLLATFTGQTTERAPREYVANLFNDYADRFEGDLVNKLGYRGPTQLRELLRRTAGDGIIFEQAIDLGCGSGLAGSVFRDMCNHLCGVDLAPRMIDQARAKGCYDDLAVADIVDYLDRSEDSFDLFIAADTFVYLGNLDALFSAISQHARTGAHLLFTTELARGSDFVLQPSGRYAHSESYLRGLAERYSLRVSAVETINLRRENNNWIRGQAFVLQCQGIAEDKAPCRCIRCL